MDLNFLFTKKARINTFHRELLADMDTPVSSFFKLNGGAHSFLLESMEGTGANTRYSIIGLKPMLIFKHLSGQSVFINPESGQEIRHAGNPFDHLRRLLENIEFDRQEPFECGFLCGYLSYDSIRYIENIPVHSENDVQLPEMLLMLPSEVVIFDTYSHTLKLVVHLEERGEAQRLERQASARLEHMFLKFFRHVQQLKELPPATGLKYRKPEVNIAKPDYLRSVIRAKEHIRNGDIFQVVLSRRFSKQISCDPFDIYRILHLINPSPYMFYLNLDEVNIVGSSPETMVKFDGERIVVRPIAGTRKRGQTPQEDQRLAEELLNDEKELAEHLMLVDLGRNDVGRIARYGTVKLDTFKQVENYSHVMHIVSTVSGELRDGFDAVDIFKACFPAGTVSGAPKVRAMEIVDELEKTSRGIYAGAVGYFDFSGRVDTCIAIRTLFVKESTAYWQAGGGIVADSQPEAEFQETENKAQALLKAITYAEEMYHDSGY